MLAMRMKDFYFDLPQELIAQFPTEKRGQSRLLVFDRKTEEIIDTSIENVLDYIPDNSLLIFNNTKVRKARVFVESETGSKVEFLFIKENADFTEWTIITNKAKKQKIGRKYILPNNLSAEIIEDLGDGYKVLKINGRLDTEYLEQFGHMPLPPYIKREDQTIDATRYQTVYSEHGGSVAAPTAGLHFTEDLLKSLNEKGRARGIEIDFVTLHVGLGTFAPVHADELKDHNMHYEEYSVSEATAEKINRAIARGKNILAVGTTSVRTLESAYLKDNGKVNPGQFSTNLFIYPGYEFKVVNKLFTNFHTPDSTLIVLVSAFAGMDNIKKAYKHAVEKSYRFFSYGDAMLIL